MPLLITILTAVLPPLLKELGKISWASIIARVSGRRVESVAGNWNISFEEWDPETKAVVKTKGTMPLKQRGSHVWGECQATAIGSRPASTARTWRLAEGEIVNNRYLVAKYFSADTAIFLGAIFLEIRRAGTVSLTGIWSGRDDSYTKDTGNPFFTGEQTCTRSS